MSQKKSSNQQPNKNNPVSNILNKPMDRGQFLKYSGSALLGVAGLSGVTKVLTQPQRQQAANKQSLSYGGGAYGGRKAA